MQKPTILDKLLGRKSLSSDVERASVFGWTPVGGTYQHYKRNDYENSYASVRAIANRFMSIQPYTINANGDKVDSPVLDKIYHPNQQMSSVDFFEALAVMSLIHDKVHILVWRQEGSQVFPGGEINKNNIGGFTFLENPTITVKDGVTTYQQHTNSGVVEYTDKEVVTLRNINPYDLSEGFSPSRAAHRWTKLDDYIADYQSGFFENGAIPAGQFIIRTKTVQEYKDIVRGLQAKHRGAGKNNNVTYVHEPIDPTTGQGAGAQIQWVSFNTDNSDLDLSTIFEQVNKKIDSAYQVPATIRGVNDSVTFASAQVDERNFVVNNIQPFALKIWTKFTHEMNRVTGGLGVAITFDIKIPQIAEDQKMTAETKSVHKEIIRTMMLEGYSLDNIVDAFELPESYKLLGERTLPEVQDDNNVDEGDEVEDAPGEDEAGKGLKDSKALSQEDEATYEQRLADVIRRHMQKQIDKAISDTKAVGDTSDQDDEDMLAEAMIIITAAMAASGAVDRAKAIELLIQAGFTAPEASAYVVSFTERVKYQNYLQEILKGYNEQTANSIRSTLDIAQANGWNRQQIVSELQNIIPREDYRIRRLATTELNRSQSVASVDAVRQIQEESGVTFEKTMMHTGGDAPCPYCIPRLGQWFPVDATMINKGDIIYGSDGSSMTYDWDDNEGHGIHANCHCIPTYRVVRDSALKALHCSQCDRFMGETKASYTRDKVKCGNSKCKALEVPVIKEIQNA